MVRRFFYSVFILILTASPVLAQEQVRVRTGDHNDYSRLVVDWGKHVEFTENTSTPGKLTLTFKSDAALSSESEISASLRNISNFKVISQSPFTISVDIPAGSKTRSFPVGDRVVVDVYDPANDTRKIAAAKPPEPAKPAALSKEEKPVEKKPEPPKEVAKQEPPKVEPPKQEPVKTEPAPAPEPEKTAEAQPATPVTETLPVTPATPAADAAAQPKALESFGAQPATGHAESHTVKEAETKKPDDAELQAPTQAEVEAVTRPNLISLNSTKTLGLAAFEREGILIIVNDQPDTILNPNVSGPDAARMAPMESFDVTGAKIFALPALEGTQIRAQGGGLLWRLLISPEIKRTKYIPGKRIGVKEDQPRSGSMLWPLQDMGKIVDVPDPVSGSVIKVVTARNAKQFAGPAQSYVDFDVLTAPIGLAILPKVDDLQVTLKPEGVEVSRPGGLAVTPESQIKYALEQKKMRAEAGAKPDPERRIFDFKSAEMGGVSALDQNRNIILAGLNDLPPANRAEGIMTLAKMYLANAQGPESLGFLDLAQHELPGIEENYEYKALLGAARAITGKMEEAFEDLSAEELKQFQEIGYWRAYVLADLGDWSQAEDVLPGDLSTLYSYPDMLFNRLALVLAEVALRAGSVEDADKLLKTLEERKDQLFEPQLAALQYLKGESARQRGDVEETKTLWKPLLEGSDDLYRAKAGLAYTRLLVDQKELTIEKAIDNLERLRYAWRGDELEAQINYWLGKTYFEKGDYVKGLNILKEASIYASETGAHLGDRVRAEMSDVFTDLFLSDKIDKVSALDAVALYEQFTDLVPKDERGDKIIEILAERLVQADLLDRAAKLLTQQVDNRLQGSEAYRVAVRLAAIELLNNKPTTAITALNKAATKLQTLPEESKTPERFQEISLLRAKALSQQGRADQALALLAGMTPTKDVNRLRTDIAWGAAYWDDAAEALDDVLMDENISLTRPLNAEHAALVLQRAVALNLASDRIALANMREQYTDAMAQTDKARVFELITRPRQSAALADRETLMGIVKEVDLFGDFLKSYKVNPTPSN
jgi:tetratricopeptide (TPR) repeat protein